MKIAVIALGSWGTAFARLLAKSGHRVTGYVRNPELLERLRADNENKKYLPGTSLDGIDLTGDIAEAVEGASIVVSAVPTQSFRKSLREYKDLIDRDVILVNLAKGIEVGTGLTLSKVAAEEAPWLTYVALSGPTHAEEVALEHPSAIVAASNDMVSAELVQDAFSCEVFRVYTSSDLGGVETAGALKNVIAIAAGIVDGIGYGDNAKAALITRGLAEITRFGLARGAKRETFSGLAGVGDMIVTCGSMHSRNLRCGRLIGQGVKPEDAQKMIGMVVEGAHTLTAVMSVLEKMDIEMPITEMLWKVFYEDFSPHEAIRLLMTRKTKREDE